MSKIGDTNIIDKLSQFRNIFNKLMKSWRNYEELKDMVKTHYLNTFKTYLNSCSNENDGLLNYIKEFMSSIEPHMDYIKIHDDGIFYDDYVRFKGHEVNLFKSINMQTVWQHLNDEDKKNTWNCLEKMYIFGKYVCSDSNELNKHKFMLYELYNNIQQDKMVGETSKFLIDNKLTVTNDNSIDLDSLTDEDFADENCISLEDKISGSLDKIKDYLPSVKNGEALCKIITKIVKKIKFPKKLMEMLEHIGENPFAIIKLLMDERVLSRLTNYMKSIGNILTPEDLDVINEIKLDESASGNFKETLEKLFNGIFTSDEIKSIISEKGELSVDQMEKLRLKLNDVEVKKAIQKSYEVFSKNDSSSKSENEKKSKPTSAPTSVKELLKEFDEIDKEN